MDLDHTGKTNGRSLVQVNNCLRQEQIRSLNAPAALAIDQISMNAGSQDEKEASLILCVGLMYCRFGIDADGYRIVMFF